MTPLAHTALAVPGAAPTRDFYFLHGILGSRFNWRSIARRLVQARPDLTAVLVDLREHGDSGARLGPNTLVSCATDLDQLAEHRARPVAGVLGHSFGGKVALTWAADPAAPMEEVWVVDSTPGPRPGRQGSERLLEVLAALRVAPRSWPSRADFVSHFVTLGFAPALCQWLAMNLRIEADKTWAMHIDLDAIERLLADYFAQDLWPVVESADVSALQLVIGGRSGVFDEEDRARAKAIAVRRPNVHLHVLPEAGHFVHVDAPDELLSLMLSGC